MNWEVKSVVNYKLIVDDGVYIVSYELNHVDIVYVLKYACI